MRFRSALRERREKFESILEADDDFFVVYRSANIAATWLSVLAAALLEELADSKGESRDEQAVALAFFSRLANDLWAIIELVESGFDLQARALARSYLEHVDVLICCIHDKELTKEFFYAVEPEQANAFWHKYVSKNKAKERVSRFISTLIGSKESRIVDLLREDAEFTGASLHHPTMLARLATALGHPGFEYDSYPLFPTPLAASAGIFRTVLIHLFWLWFAMGTLPKSDHGEWKALFDSARIARNKEFDRLENLYSQMFGFLLDYRILMDAPHPDGRNG